MYKKYIILAIGLAVIGGALFLIQSTRTSKNITEISVVKGGPTPTNETTTLEN